MKNAVAPLLTLLAMLSGLCSCQSTNPTAGDMDRFYKEAQTRAERQIARYGRLRDQGNITEDEYQEKVTKTRNAVGQSAMEIAWSKHEMAESLMRDLSIPTGGHPVQVQAPGVGNSVDSFYRAAGADGGGGYQGVGAGMGAGMWHGYTPGSTIDSITAAIGTR